MQSTAESTLRQRIEMGRAQGRPFSPAEAIQIVATLATELAQQHEAGYNFFVYPSALYLGQDGNYHASQASGQPPGDPRDRACLPPECAGGTPGGARASVYGVGAMLYELLTLQSIGGGRAPVAAFVPGAPPELDLILNTALTPQAEARPADLRALSQALYQIHQQATFAAASPVGTQAQEPARRAPLPTSFDIDVSMSLMPKAPAPSPRTALAPVVDPKAVHEDDLHTIKMRLESDPAPRYMVIRQGMDHGPFRAVELLQQIASHTFEEEDQVRAGGGPALSIKDHPDFGPFARHARLHRHEKAEKAALVEATRAESRSTRGKTMFLLIALIGILAVVAAVVLKRTGEKDDKIAVIEEVAANVESDAGLKAKKGGGGGARVLGTSGGIPQLAGGMSCEAAQNAYVEEMKMGEKRQADLTAGQFQQVLGNGSYLNSCGVPDSMSVNVCAAVQNGRAVGVTVTTTPRNPGVSSCISSRVRGMSFPSHPKLDVTRTSFAAN
jgi:eukaryotic-like serine/threonine-protein kinase